MQWSFSFETGERVNCSLALTGTLEGALLFWFSGFIQLEASGRAERKALGHELPKNQVAVWQLVLDELIWGLPCLACLCDSLLKLEKMKLEDSKKYRSFSVL